MARFGLADAIDAVSGSPDNGNANSQGNTKEGILEVVIIEEDVVVDPEVGSANNDGKSKDEHEECPNGGETFS